MESPFLAYEPWVRIGIFALTLVAMLLWELAAPRRVLAHARRLRWLPNLALAALNAFLPRIVLPTTAVGLAILGQEQGWGLFNQLPIPPAVASVVAVIALDLAIYIQHVLFHAVPVLWRLHRMHHADLDFDTTTGVRFHPLEALLSAGIKLAVVAALGPSPLAVVTFEVLLSATAMFNHGNVRLPGTVDRLLRWAVVTPDMHRIHHSAVPRETNSNFGFNLSWWDRLFGTYREDPALGHERIVIGLRQFRDRGDLALGSMLLQPFRSADDSLGGPQHRPG